MSDIPNSINFRVNWKKKIEREEMNSSQNQFSIPRDGSENDERQI